MKPTPAEEHIMRHSERRDLTSICQRLAKLEDRMAAVDRKAALAHQGTADNTLNIEALKESLEGAHERIERLTLSQQAAEAERLLKAAGIPQAIIDDLVKESRQPGKVEPFPGPAKPFDFGAELRRSVDEANRDAGLRIDWDIVSGKREPAPATPPPGMLGDGLYPGAPALTVARIARRVHKLRIELLRSALEYAATISHSGSVHDSIMAALKADADMERDYGHED